MSSRMQRIGANLYEHGRTRDDLLRTAGERGGEAAEQLEWNDGERACWTAAEAASNALDATVRARADGPLRNNYVWHSESAALPAPGTVLEEMPAWGWRVRLLGVIGGAKPSYRDHDVELVRVGIEQDGAADVPTPRNPGFGLWGTWRVAMMDEPDNPLRPADVWRAVFEVLGEAESGRNDALRDELDGRTGREYADELLSRKVRIGNSLRDAIREMGRPEEWRTGGSSQ